MSKLIYHEVVGPVHHLGHFNLVGIDLYFSKNILRHFERIKIDLIEF